MALSNFALQVAKVLSQRGNFLLERLWFEEASQPSHDSALGSHSQRHRDCGDGKERGYTLLQAHVHACFQPVQELLLHAWVRIRHGIHLLAWRSTRACEMDEHRLSRLSRLRKNVSQAPG